jgi:di/tricarboxylate transporter
MIALGASSSFLTPLEPAALLVYGPGNYKFSDFPRVGWLLTLIILALSLLLVPRIWPL